jgi:hypothetical protein
MKITIAQVLAANEAMTHLNELKPKPSLILTLALAANALQPFLAAHEKAHAALVDKCFDLSKAVQIGNQQQAPFRLLADGTPDPAMPIAWVTGQQELLNVEVEWTLGMIPVSVLDSLEPPPSIQDVRALAWMLKE